jgi:hypothetical protein
MSNRSIGVWLLLAGVATGVTSGTGRAMVDAPLLAQTAAPPPSTSTYQLASAQVILPTEGPPILKLAANGPIAFASLPADDAGIPASPARIVARLYGVSPGDVAAPVSVAPFVVTVRSVDNDSVVTIEVPGLPAGHALTLRSSHRTSELEVVIAATP